VIGLKRYSQEYIIVIIHLKFIFVNALNRNLAHFMRFNVRT